MRITFALSFLALIAVVPAVSGRNALDLQSRAALHRDGVPFVTGVSSLDSRNAARRARAVRTDALRTGFIRLADGADPSVLSAFGVEVLSERGGIIVAQFPASGIDSISQSPYVRSFSLARELEPKLDKARASVGVDKIHSGLDLPRAYTGKGVVTGIVDGGMDPNHINFTDADGNCRVKYLTFRRYNDAGTAMLTSEYTPDKMSGFTTDDPTTYHGTHTMGIMAGSYRGDVRLARATGEDGNIILTTAPNPYYGVAYDADIMASCGTLQDAFIAYGISGILDRVYADGADRKPVVFNLSLGSNLGPHDGRGMLSQYIAAESPYAIFCISAGNEGDMRIALNKTFSETDTQVRTFIKPVLYGSEYGNIRQGTINVYSEDTSEFDLQVVVFNTKRGREIVRLPLPGNTDGVPLYYVSSSDYDYTGSGTVSPNFAKAFHGYVGVGSMIDEESGRYYAIIDYATMDNEESNKDENYILGFIVSAPAGKRVDIFCDGITTELDSYGMEDWSDGMLNGTISDLATTPNTIVVGSYDTRDSWLSLDGNAYGYDGLFVDGTISEFSSFGTIIDGRNLPTVCAPGATVVSSTSVPFVSNLSNGISDPYLQAGVTKDGTTYHWEQMAGTSMASPLVAGSIALWLEADPTLNTADVTDIITSTAKVDADVTSTGDPVQWGAGKFDAYAGLKEVLARAAAGVGTVAAEGRAPLLSACGDRAFEVFLADAESLDIRVYDMSGRQAAAVSADGCSATVDLSALAKGIYVVNVNGTESTRIILK